MGEEGDDQPMSADFRKPTGSWGALLKQAQRANTAPQEHPRHGLGGLAAKIAAAPPRPTAGQRSVEATRRSSSAALHNVLARAKRRLEEVMSSQPHQVLGVAPGAPEPEVRSAYVAFSKAWHPDRFLAFNNRELTSIANQLFIHGQRAYAQLASRRR